MAWYPDTLVSNQFVSPASGEGSLHQRNSRGTSKSVSNQFVSPASGELKPPMTTTATIVVSNQFVSPASGEFKKGSKSTWIKYVFPINLFPQRVGRNRTKTIWKYGKPCISFQSICFPSEWGAIFRFPYEALIIKVSNQFVSPASGEVGICHRCEPAWVQGGFQSICFPSEWGVITPYANILV